MGLVKSTKVNSIRTDAERAYTEGRNVFVARFWDEHTLTHATGSVSGVAEGIESVEEAGWRLDYMSYSWVPEKKRGVTLMVFRVITH